MLVQNPVMHQCRLLCWPVSVGTSRKVLGRTDASDEADEDRETDSFIPTPDKEQSV